MRTYRVQETSIVRNWKKKLKPWPLLDFMVSLDKQIKAITHNYVQINIISFLVIYRNIQENVMDEVL